ncbi:MAG TPA: glycosyltransferase family 39 protein, partial [Gammaproteobacteria bacterium]|nr:glycosyltransferase family 39 protein [Gammaproteobacteria bacterium]
MKYRILELNTGGEVLNKRTKMALWLILSATLVLKLAVVLLLIPKLTEYLPYTIGGFVDRYDNIAENLLSGNGYRIYPDTSETLLRSPGYVLLLTGLFYLFGKSLAAAQVINILFGLATAYIIALITRQWVMPRSTSPDGGGNIEWAPLFPAMLFLFYPGIILAETRGGVESFFILLLTSLVFFLYRLICFNRTRDYVVAGVTLGLTMLVKSTPALIPLAFFPYLLLRAKSVGVTRVSVVTNFAAMGLAALIVLTPWGLRNYGLTGDFMLTSTVKGTTAHQGLYVNKHFGSGRDRDPLLIEATDQQSAIADELGIKHLHGFFNVFYSVKDEV